jgi:hypothetical protein
VQLLRAKFEAKNRVLQFCCTPSLSEAAHLLRVADWLTILHLEQISRNSLDMLLSIASDSPYLAIKRVNAVILAVSKTHFSKRPVAVVPLFVSEVVDAALQTAEEDDVGSRGNSATCKFEASHQNLPTNPASQ